MKTASYREGLEMIASYEDSACLDVTKVRELFSVGLLAYLFGEENNTVAQDVVKLRLKRRFVE